MATVFALLYFAAFIVFLVFIIKSGRKKKRGEDNSTDKKIWIIALAVFFVSFILTGVFNQSKPKEEAEEPVAEIPVTEESAPEPKEETSTPTPTPTETPEPTEEETIIEEEEETVENDLDDADDETSKVRKQVQKYIDEGYTFTTIDKITLNEDLGTDEEGDYVALVYLTWSQKNGGKLSQKVLDMYSSDMAAKMYDDLPEIQELAVFWTVPYLDGNAKISFERKDNGMAYTDKVFDKSFSN